jgi:hypothetical protein
MTDIELTKNELKRFFEQNNNLFTLDTPFENWNDSVTLFSSNDSVKGKVFFKLNSIEFKLKHKAWMPYTMSGIRDYNSEHWFKKPLEIVKNGEFIFPSDENGKLIYEQIPSLCNNIKDAKQNYLIEFERKKLEEQRLAEANRLENLFKSKSQILLDLDKNNDGVIDVIEGNDFNKILQKNQKLIIDIDRSYIQKFVKVSNYIKNKKEFILMSY